MSTTKTALSNLTELEERVWAMVNAAFTTDAAELIRLYECDAPDAFPNVGQVHDGLTLLKARGMIGTEPTRLDADADRLGAA